MKDLRRIFTSPYFLSLIPFLLIVSLFPLNFEKYLLKSDDNIFLPNNVYLWYYDLDNDGFSEKITAFNEDNTTGITIRNDNVVDQWNFRGTFDFSSIKCLFIAGDKESDGQQELYVFTLHGDTILLNCISDFRNPILTIKNRPIAVAGKGNKASDPFIIPAEMDDLNGDGEKELIFGIGSGFSKYPRNVFAYFISNDSLIVSPESSYFITKILQTDINGDGKKEIIPYGYAACNISPDDAEYHDYSSFLMVLDQNLKFLFNPVEFKGKYSGLTPASWNKNGNNSLIWLHNLTNEISKSVFYFVDDAGSVTDSVGLDFYALNCLNIPDNNNRKGRLLVSLADGIGLLDSDLEIIESLPEVNAVNIIQQDVDLDGRKEIIITDSQKGKLHIYREGLTDGVNANIMLSGEEQELISLKFNNNADPVISVQSEQNHFTFRYEKNPAYPYYYLYYPGIYLSIFAFAVFIRSIQKNQIRKRYETEKQISELQLALIRNQLDPHFTLNVISSIIYSVEYSGKELAGKQLRQFSNLYRNMVLSAGSTRRSLAEELDFCNDYLLLEKMRFTDTFEFKISVSEDVDIQLLVPKFLIQIHAENAVKHGLSKSEKSRTLYIDVKNSDESLIIDVVDNGIGRKKAGGQQNSSTGKGLEIMNELYSVYNKYYNQKISSQITDLFDYEGFPSGTKVSISINSRYSKKPNQAILN